LGGPLEHGGDALLLGAADPEDRRPRPDQQIQLVGPLLAHRHWRRAKIGRRFRLFFRFDSKTKIIIFAWVNDEHTLRSSGAKTDPYVVFQKMLKSGHPPDDWDALLAEVNDVQVVLSTALATLRHNAVEGALKKSADDIGRGVRGG
jgi:hypothetical protein